MTLPIVPRAWRGVLGIINENCNPSRINYIAGGALRDLVLGRVPRDVDICVQEGAWCGPEHLQSLRALGFESSDIVPHPVTEDDLSAPADDRGITRVFDFAHDGFLFQIVERRSNPSPADKIREHDFGICAVAWDGDTWYVSDDFLSDLDSRVFKTRADAKYAKSTLRRADKFAQRFQGWAYDLRSVGGDAGVWP